jgi:hypothetical protein
MKIVATVVLALSFLSIMGVRASAQMAPQAVAALQRPIKIERDESVSRVPLIQHMGKLSVDAKLNDVERQFIFDTGSPSLISRQLAEELDLEIIGTNTGVDANGREVTTDIAVVDRMTIGGVNFRNVPVLITDFAVADPDGCFFDGGVIGSEIFPGSVWHIDVERQELQIAERFADLPGGTATHGTIVAPLHDFGYPHAPIFDYAIDDFSDRGLFDTGSSDTITLFERVAQDDRVRSAMISGTVLEGRGSHGVSAAGQGEDTDLMRFDIDGIRLGQTELGRQIGTTRSAPPSLMGLGILDTHSVTLDYPRKRIFLHPHDQPHTASAYPGYALMHTGGEVRVVQLFDGSQAQRAGLELGDQVVAIDDRDFSSEESTCGTTRWLVEARPAQSASRLTVLRDGQRVEIDIAGQ